MSQCIVILSCLSLAQVPTSICDSDFRSVIAPIRHYSQVPQTQPRVPPSTQVHLERSYRIQLIRQTHQGKRSCQAYSRPFSALTSQLAPQKFKISLSHHEHRNKSNYRSIFSQQSSPTPPTPSAATPPIVYLLQDRNSDVRLVVVKQEFLVHSEVLKVHSAYFNKFLHSPEKVHTPISWDFKCDYISIIDADGQWGLEAMNMVSLITLWE